MARTDPTVCAVILARNEERQIEEAIRSVLWADQVLLIDNKSEDRTVEIARLFTPHTLSVPASANVDAYRNLGAQHAGGGWVYFQDADERVPRRLPPVLRRLIAERGHEFDGLCLPFKHFFCGKWMEHSGWWPGYKGPQLVKRDRY